MEKDVAEVDTEVDTVVMNPPFGTKVRNKDREFLLKAFSLSKKVFSMHKTSTLDFLVELVKKSAWNLDEVLKFRFMLKQTMPFHSKEKHYVDVCCLCCSHGNVSRR